MVVLIVLIVAGVWVFGVLFTVSLCRAAAHGDRVADEEVSRRWLSSVK